MSVVYLNTLFLSNIDTLDISSQLGAFQFISIRTRPVQYNSELLHYNPNIGHSSTSIIKT